MLLHSLTNGTDKPMGVLPQPLAPRNHVPIFKLKTSKFKIDIEFFLATLSLTVPEVYGSRYSIVNDNFMSGNKKSSALMKAI